MDKTKIVVEVRGDVRRIHLGPNDVLLVKLHTKLSSGEIEQASAEIGRVFSRVGIDRHRWLVIDDQADIVVGENVLPPLQQLVGQVADELERRVRSQGQ